MSDCCQNLWKKSHYVTLACLQIIIIILFALFVRYDDTRGKYVNGYYPLFQDVNVMVFVGFGYLMSFLKRYGYSSVGFSLLIGSFSIEVAMLTRGIIDMIYWKESTFPLSAEGLFGAEFSAATVLISFGALIGKTSVFQLIIITVIEVILAAINELILTHYLEAVDIGGSMLIHVFGAYFGLVISRILYKPDSEYSPKEGSVYQSDVFSFIGTVFLWCFWPSFNGGMAVGEERYRAIVNTLLSLAACTVSTFVFSSVFDRRGKLTAAHVQNASLAGGVVVGTTANFILHPFGAVILGSVGGLLSVTGFTYIQPYLKKSWKVHDTCGVNNLHGMPGILGALAGIVASAVAHFDTYGDSLYEIFPGRTPVNETILLTPSDGRSASMQAVYQLIALVVTLAISIVGGFMTGILLKIPIWKEPRNEALFEDATNWNLPEDMDFHEIMSGEHQSLIHD